MRRYFFNVQPSLDDYAPLAWGRVEEWLEVVLDADEHGFTLREIFVFPEVQRSVVMTAEDDFDPFLQGVRGDRRVELAGLTMEWGWTEVGPDAFEEAWSLHAPRNAPP